MLALRRMFPPGLQFDGVEKRWRRLVVHGLVSEDAAFDARRTAPPVEHHSRCLR